MAERHDRAKLTLDFATEYVDALITGWQQQVKDVKDIATEALDNGSYPVKNLVPDVLAFWLNGAGVVKDAFLGGRTTTPVPGGGGGGGGGGGQ